MTGSFSPAPVAGVQTLRYRQSSLMFRAGVPGDGAAPAFSACGQVSEYSFTSFTPVQGWTGAGGLHRSSPVGGAANGIPW